MRLLPDVLIGPKPFDCYEQTCYGVCESKQRTIAGKGGVLLMARQILYTRAIMSLLLGFDC